MNVHFKYNPDGAISGAFCLDCGWEDKCPFDLAQPQPRSGMKQWKEEANLH